MKVLSKDYIELNKLKTFLKKHKSISVDEVHKKDVAQSMLNNKYFHDFDMDGYITFSDYTIAWNWVAQGKPTDIFEFIKSKSATPNTHKLPYQPIQDNQEHILLDNRVPVYEEDVDAQTLSEIKQASSHQHTIIKANVEELSSDYNGDGQVDEEDLEILEGYILMNPGTLSEYNTNRGSYPEASVLPNTATAKFACDPTYHYGDINKSGHGIINDDDIVYYLEILRGDVPLPGENTLSFLLSNTIKQEVIKICELEGGLSESTMCVKFMDGVFAKQSREDFTGDDPTLYTLAYDQAKVDELGRVTWTYTDADVYIEVGGKLDNAWYIMVEDTSPEPNGNFFSQFHRKLYYVSQRDDDAIYPWCADWEWDSDYDDSSFPLGEHTGDDRYTSTILSNLDETFMSPILRLVDEMQQDCSIYSSQSAQSMQLMQELDELAESSSLISYTAPSSSEVERDYTGPSFRHVLMACNIRDEIVDKELHSVMLMRVDYRDYLIMKEWLRLENPDEKNLQSRSSLIAWFNTNSKSGTPFACELPYQIYDWIGSGTAFTNAVSGEENL